MSRQELVLPHSLVPSLFLAWVTPGVSTEGGMGLGVVGRHGPLLSPHPCQACFSSSHSHQEAILAIGDATTVMGGQVRGGLGKGGFTGQGLISLWVGGWQGAL